MKSAKILQAHCKAYSHFWALSCFGFLVAFLPRGKWRFVDFFELLPANVTESTHQNIRKLCSGDFLRNGRCNLPWRKNSIMQR